MLEFILLRASLISGIHEHISLIYIDTVEVI